MEENVTKKKTKRILRIVIKSINQNKNIQKVPQEKKTQKSTIM